MNRYKIESQAISLHSGVIELTRSQAEPRLGNLEGNELAKAHAKGSPKSDVRARYTIVGMVQFKVGEVIGFEGELPKVYADAMIDLDAMHASEVAAQQSAIAQEAAAEANRIAATQHAELVAAMAGINGGPQGNIDLGELTKLLKGRVNFDPTFEQLEAAWAEHVA